MSEGATEPLLAHREVRADGGGAGRWLWFLHGVFGAGRNWRSIARRLAGSAGGWGALLLDLRLHGDSREMPPPHTLTACADDLRALVAAEDRSPAVVLGHSFGGKVALELARDPPADLGQVWVIDASPSAREPGGDAVRMLEAARAHPGPFATREEGVEALVGRGFPSAVARWMATNLEPREEGLRWRLDFDALEALLADFFRRDLWPVLEPPPDDLELHFVKAEDSQILTEEECRRVERAGADHGRVHLHRLAGGHWLNVSNPDGLLELLLGRLP